MKSHRYFWEIAHDVSHLPDGEKASALRSARILRPLCFFCYGRNVDIDLPREPLADVATISPRAFTKYEQGPSYDQDLGGEMAPKLVRLFARGVNAGLDAKPAKRWQLWLDFIARLSPGGERNLFEVARVHHRINGIPIEVVEEAWPELLDTPVELEPLPTPPVYLNSAWPLQTEPQHAPPAPPQQREPMSESELDYARRMRALGFG